jgi:hypothetical protein
MGTLVNLNEEMRGREQALDEMLAARLSKDMEALRVTIDDYSQDMRLVVDHFTRFLTGADGLNVIDRTATRAWKRDSSRLLRNYLAARMTLRDHTYVLTKRYWEGDDKVGRPEDTAFMEPYKAKVQALLIQPQFSFLQDLRNYGVHVALYPFVLNTQWAGPYMKNEIHLDKAKLLGSYDSWTAPAKKYINSQGDRVDLLTPMEEWSRACARFYEWFHGAVKAHHQADIQALETATEEYRQWRRDNGTMPPDWFLNGGEPPGNGSGPRSARRTRSSQANKKRKRKQRKRR